MKIYEDNAKEKLSDERFSMMSGNYVGARTSLPANVSRKSELLRWYRIYSAKLIDAKRKGVTEVTLYSPLKIGIFNFFLFYGHRPNCRAFLLDKTRYKPPGIILLL